MQGIEKTVLTVIKNGLSRKPETVNDDGVCDMIMKIKPEELEKLEDVFRSDEYRSESSILDELNEDSFLDALDSGVLKAVRAEEKPSKEGFVNVTLENLCEDIQERITNTTKKYSHRKTRKAKP